MLDPDLRKYFNFGRRKFSSIVKKPGVRRGFKLSQYIHPTDSPEEVNQVLRRIAEHIEYHKTSPVREVFHQQFKAELTHEKAKRHPRKYLIELKLGMTLTYFRKKDGKTEDKTEYLDTNRNVTRKILKTLTPRGLKKYLSGLHFKDVYVYHGSRYAAAHHVKGRDEEFRMNGRYVDPTVGEGPFRVLGFDEESNVESNAVQTLEEAANSELLHGLKRDVHASVRMGYQIVEIWLEAPPTIKEEFSANEIVHLKDELLERASVLTDNFLKHAGGIHELAKKETESKCVETQLLEFFLNPTYTDPITKIPSAFGAEAMTPLTKTSLRAYLDSIPKSREGEGYSTYQLGLMCTDIHLNLYALDHDSKCF